MIERWKLNVFIGHFFVLNSVLNNEIKCSIFWRKTATIFLALKNCLKDITGAAAFYFIEIKNGVILTWKVESLVELKFDPGFRVIEKYFSQFASQYLVNLTEIFSNYSESRVEFQFHQWLNLLGQKDSIFSFNVVFNWKFESISNDTNLKKCKI